jgi:branched-subunit amino acid aminotransferase/4-amino-4-deoxychorismate lyase
MLPRTLHGKIRSSERHLVRLQTSVTAVGCPLPSQETLIEWLKTAAASADPNNAPGCLQLIATKGGSSVPWSVIISWSPIPDWPETFTLHPLLAPWHPAGAPGWEAPIKWTSYGPNVVSTQKAKDAGFADALLLSNDRLESSFRNHFEDCHVLDCHHHHHLRIVSSATSRSPHSIPFPRKTTRAHRLTTHKRYSITP